MRNLLQDIRFGHRVFASSPAFACAAVLTLGVGIASTTTVFSWIDSVILHPYPGTTRSDELAALEMVTAGAPNGGNAASWLDYRDYRDRFKSLSGLAVHRQCAFTLDDAQPARLAWGELVSGNYFEVMGVEPVLGRVFTREERGDSLGAYPVVVISARMWRSYFQSDPKIIGKIMRVNRHALTIVGVVPAALPGHIARHAVRFLGARHHGRDPWIAARDRLHRTRRSRHVGHHLPPPARNLGSAGQRRSHGARRRPHGR